MHDYTLEKIIRQYFIIVMRRNMVAMGYSSRPRRLPGAGVKSNLQ